MFKSQYKTLFQGLVRMSKSLSSRVKEHVPNSLLGLMNVQDLLFQEKECSQLTFRVEESSRFSPSRLKNVQDSHFQGPKMFKIHYNNRGLFCDPHIIANNKERSFRKPAFANHNSSQTLKLLRYHNIRTRTIASPSQFSNLIQSQNFSHYNCFYILFAINITSKTICNKPITATT